MKSVAIDIGTTSISAVIADAQRRRVERAWTVANPGFIAGQPWERLQDAEGILSAARALLDEVLAAAGDVAAIGLTGQMHGIVYLDGAGRPVGPLATWQDRRGEVPLGDGRSLCWVISEKYGVAAYTGYGLVTHLFNLIHGLVPPRARCLATIADALGLAVTGHSTPLLHSSNAASLGLYDLEKHAWRADILEDFGGDGAILPETTDRFETLGSYRGIPVAVAIGDNQASFLGAVGDAKSELLINMGTGGQISVLSRRVYNREEIETRPFNEDVNLIVGSSLCGGRAYATLAGFFRACAAAFGREEIDVYTVMEKLAAQGADGDPMVVDTRFAGTRAHPALRGGISNLTAENFTPAGLTRGVLEGMARELLEHYRAIEAGVGERRTRIVASGNGMRKIPALRAIAERDFGMALTLSQTREEAAYGAALAALCAVDRLDWRDTVGFSATNHTTWSR